MIEKKKEGPNGKNIRLKEVVIIGHVEMKEGSIMRAFPKRQRT
jgi:hypothetical protein